MHLMSRLPLCLTTAFICSFMIILFFCCSHASAENAKQKDTSLPKPYFLLVTSANENEFKKINYHFFRTINANPYHGIAVRVLWEYDDQPVDYDRIAKSAIAMHKNVHMDIWPLVYLNRIIGDDGVFHVKEIIRNKRVFREIKGMDLYDEKKMLSNFYDIWRFSLRLAKQIESPGIVFDIEAYNKYEINKVDLLASKFDKPREEIIARLLSIGERLTEITAEEYPGTMIWFLFTHLAEPIPSWYPQTVTKLSVSYIVEGMLNKAEKMNLKIKFIDGGETALGYCHRSQEQLELIISNRNEMYKQTLLAHRNLYLGGTIAPWNDTKAKTSWMMEKECRDAEMKTMADFIPMIKTLSKAYDYVWIYATPVAGYNPFNLPASKPFNEALKSIIKPN